MCSLWPWQAYCVIFAGTLTWWIATALHAPWFFGSMVPRSPTSPAPLVMILLGLLMLSGLVLAGVGMVPIAGTRVHSGSRYNSHHSEPLIVQIGTNGAWRPLNPTIRVSTAAGSQ